MFKTFLCFVVPKFWTQLQWGDVETDKTLFRFYEMTKHEICLVKERFISMYIVYIHERL